ncbi:MAG: TonB-dependent receptor, partial [Pseudomonadota bacterium]
EEPNNGQAAGGSQADKTADSETFSGGFFFNPSNNPVLDAEVTVYRVNTKVDETNLTGTSIGQLQEREITTFGFNADNTSRFALGESADVAVTAGVDYYQEDAFGAQNGGVRGGVVTGDQSLVGFFVQSAFNFYDVFGTGTEVTVTPGIRYDRFESDDTVGNTTGDNQLSPKISASVSPVPWGFVYGSYGEAFRAPRLDELFATGTHFPVFNTAGTAPIGFNTFIANTTLKPQTTETWEVGAGVEFENVFSEGDIFQAKGGYYSTDGENFLSTEVIQSANIANPQFFGFALISPPFTCRAFVSINVDPNGCGGTTQIVNIPSAELSGTELEATYDSSRFRVAVAGTTMDTENKQTGNPIGTEQPDQITADLRLKLPEVDSIIGWQSTFADSHDGGTVTANDRDAYDVHEVYARWQASEGVLDGFSIGVRAENLFDEEYQRVSSDTLEEGRSVLVDVTYTTGW